MSDAPFIKFYPSDFLGGTSGLSPAERGVYITLLCLIYEMDAPIQRDDARLARRCGAPKAAFVRILNELLDQGKITEADGDLSAPIVTKWLEIQRRQSRRPAIPASVREAVWQRDGAVCQYCSSESGPFHLDHVIPWSRGGEHEASNLRVTCATCNLAKGSMTLEEWGGFDG